jgi:hypothetical protein
MQWHKGAQAEMFLVEDDGQVAYKKVWPFLRETAVGKDNSITKNTSTMLPRI